MREISIYLADDGKVFLDEDDCNVYEFQIKHTLIYEIEFYGKEGNRMYIDSENYLDSLEKIVEAAYKVVLHSERELEQFKELYDWIGVPCSMEEYITSPGSWIWIEPRRYRYCDEDSWVREGTKIAITDIEWDIDEDEDDEDENRPHLPKEIIIENPTGQMCEAVGGFTNAIDDYLSDTYGYCIYGYNAEFVE